MAPCGQAQRRPLGAKLRLGLGKRRGRSIPVALCLGCHPLQRRLLLLLGLEHLSEVRLGRLQRSTVRRECGTVPNI